MKEKWIKPTIRKIESLNIPCHRCNEFFNIIDSTFDSQGDAFCSNCINELLQSGIYKSLQELLGFDD
jgi:formylmethanofuran dehydrogenase subunit E